MSRDQRRTRYDERGASLALAIVFLVVVGAIAMATLGSITTGLNHRRNLDAIRDREYGADAAIQYAIANVWTTPNGGPAVDSCATPLPPYSINGTAYHVDCKNAFQVTFSGFQQRNVIFTACPGSAVCTDATRIIRAEVNFETRPVGGGSSAVVVTRTWVQSWSVKA